MNVLPNLNRVSLDKLEERKLGTKFPFGRWKKLSSAHRRKFVYLDLYEARMAQAARELQQAIKDIRNSAGSPATYASVLRCICRESLISLYSAFVHLLLDHIAYAPVDYDGGRPRPDTPVVQSLHFISPSLGKWFRWPLFRTRNAFKSLVPDPHSFDTYASNYLNIPFELNVSLTADEPFSSPFFIRFEQKGEYKVAAGELEGVPFIRMTSTAVETLAKTLRCLSLTQILGTDCRLSNLIAVSKSDLRQIKGYRPSIPTLAKLLYYLVENPQKSAVLDKGIKNIGKKPDQSTRLLKRFLVTAAGMLMLTPGALCGYDVWVIPLFNMRPTPRYEAGEDEHNQRALIPGEKMGTWVVMLRSRANVRVLEKHLTEQGHKLVRFLRETESPPQLSVSYGTGNLEYEKVLRECIHVEEDVLKKLNQLKGRIKDALKNNNVKETYEKWDFFQNIAAYSQVALQLFLDLHRVVQNEEVVEHDPELEIRNSPIIFLYSGPGCGKEMLSETIYALSNRASGLGLEEKADRAWHYIQRWKKLYPDSVKFFYPSSPIFWKKKSSKDFVSKLFKADSGPRQERRFQVVNCAMLPKNDCMTDLVGSLKAPAGLFRAHIQYGGIFLDEFNTLAPGSEHLLLRAMDKPYEVKVPTLSDAGLIKSVTAYPDIRPLVIFASNKTPQQLVANGFNPAVIYRISQNFFRIPPLRERKEDIAVAFLQMVLKWKSELKPKRIEINGLRLICELPWPDNYRGLKGVANELESWRMMRHITAEELSFDEIVGAVSRRELLHEALPARQV